MTETHASESPKTLRFSAFFNPIGKSTKIEFTRGWTLLFFCQVFIILGPWFTALIIGTVGGDPTPIQKFGLYGSALVFGLTTFMSFVLHSRRLRDAGKTSLWAIFILLPLFIAIGLFTLSVRSSAQAYEKMYDERVAYVASPEEFEAQKAKEKQEKANEERDRAIAACEAARAKAADANKDVDRTLTCMESVEGAEKEQGGQGNRGKKSDPAYKSPTPPQVAYVLESNLPIIQYVIIPLSLFLAIWSLMWVARAPFVGIEALRQPKTA